MDRRRHNPPRAATTEELEIWSRASESLKNLSEMYNDPAPAETVNRVNRLISAWPQNDSTPAEGYEGVKPVYKKLRSGLNEIQTQAKAEVELIDNAIGHLRDLIDLRKKTSEAVPQEKRNKRPRAPSASRGSTPGTPSLGSNKITLPKRDGRIPFSRDPKARREALAEQLPLQEGRKVAFHPPAGKTSDGSSADVDENTWILAVVVECINQDKNRYVVQDVEPQENGQPGQKYPTTLRAIIPLPDPSQPPTSAAHPNAYQQFPANSTVMALYPDTSCFYRAEVIAPPQDVQPSGRTLSSKLVPTYKLKFEDDDDQEHSVAAQWVVEWPGQ